MFKMFAKESSIQSYFPEKSKLACLLENPGCALQGIAGKRTTGTTMSVQGLLGNKKICKVFLQIDTLGARGFSCTVSGCSLCSLL